MSGLCGFRNRHLFMPCGFGLRLLCGSSFGGGFSGLAAPAPAALRLRLFHYGSGGFDLSVFVCVGLCREEVSVSVTS